MIVGMSSLAPLTDLLAPYSTESFWSVIFEEKMLYIPQTSFRCALSAELLSFCRFEQIIWEHQSHLPDILEIPRNGFKLEPRLVHRNNYFRWAIDEFRGGGTLIITGLEKFDLQLALFCRGLEEQLNFRVGVNAYATPPNSQGFRTHFDDHDVFVLQIEGSKDWTVFNSLPALPLDNDSGRAKPEVSKQDIFTRRLVPGDLLYIPRGMFHHAKTGEQSSLHLTIGIRSYRNLDMLNAIIRCYAEKTRDCRKSFKLFETSLDGKRAVDSLLQHISKDENFDELFEKAIKLEQNKYVSGLSHLPDELLTSALSIEEIEIWELVQKRKSMQCIAQINDGHAALTFPGVGYSDHSAVRPSAIEGPAEIFDVFEYIALQNDFFSAIDLPGNLSIEGRKKLISFLVREGLLRKVTTTVG
jgi:hypothetical protein